MALLEALISRYRRKGLLIDANLLIVYLVGLLGTHHLANCQATKTFSSDDFDLLVRFLNCFEPLVTTPHVLTEVSNLAGRLPYSLHNDFRVILREVVGKDTTREESRPSKSIVVCEDFLRFGIADTAISMIAPGRYLVLTAELALAGRLKKRGVDVINFNNHRFTPWQ